MLDILPLAARLALQSITEAFVLTDPHARFVHANAQAADIFPQLASLEPGTGMDTVTHWPFQAAGQLNASSDIPFTLPGDKHYIACISTIKNKQVLLGYIILITDVTEIVSLRVNAEQQTRTIMDSIAYAGKIQRNLLPHESVMKDSFSDYSVIWKPRDIVGGDIYWTRRFDNGVVLCVADCTGHGTPGALLTMLVTSALESVVRTNNCGDTADIIYKLDKRLSSVLHVYADSTSVKSMTDIRDGCDIAVLFISPDGSVRFSSGKISLFVCDGKDVIHYKGQRIFVGEGRINSKDDVKVTDIPANPGNKYYVASDGLFDQIVRREGTGGGARVQFGYDSFKQIILDNHSNNLDAVTAAVWEEHERCRADEPQRDDMELVAFMP